MMGLNTKSNTEVILIDCFDTLIYRDCEANEVISKWASVICEHYKILNASDIYNLRLNAQTQLAKKKPNNEYTYEDIIQYMYDVISSRSSICITKEQFFNEALEIEMTLEKEALHLNTELYSAINHRKESENILCCLVSDFYLSAECLKDILDSLDCGHVIDRIFVSCDYLKSKRNGTLYEAVISELNISPRNMFMIGDNKKADYNEPRKIGIPSCLYKPKNNLTCERRYQERDFRISQQDYKVHRGISSYSKLLYIFCEKLYKECLNESIRTVYFFSREGQFLKRLFDRYVQELDYSIETKYLYVSRNSTYLPSLRCLENERFEGWLNSCPSEKRTLRKLLHSLSFSSEEIQKMGLSERLLNEPIQDYSEIKAKLITNRLFVNNYTRKRTESRTHLLKYLANNGINDDNKEICIVDIGWNGTIQDNIYKLFDGKKAINGYYYGLISKGNMIEANKKKGLVFDIFSSHDAFPSDVLLTDYQFMENICGADHGKTIGYNEDGLPLLNDDISVKAFEKCIKKMQNRIYNSFLDDLHIKQHNEDDDVACYLYAQKHMSLLDNKMILHTYFLSDDGFIDEKSKYCFKRLISRLLSYNYDFRKYRFHLIKP